MKTFSKRFLLPCLLMACGVLLIVLGVFRGEAEAVYQKAVHICLECIGIG